MKTKNKHIMNYKLEELTKKTIHENLQSKFFFKLVYKKKIHNKVYTYFDGVNSKNSVYISFQESFEKINNLKKKLEKFFFLKLNFNFYSQNQTKSNIIITFIPFITDNKFLEIYIRFSNDIFDTNKIKKYIDGELHVISEEGINIKFKNNEYLFII